jgi:hypothetical protein
MKGLEWLARVGPSPLDPWRFVMGWSEVAARNHARRLEREGWLGRCPMTRGGGSLFFVTRKGVLVLGVPLIGSTMPAPTWWAHHSACAWTAAWLALRGREFLGPRELLIDPGWSQGLEWRDRSGFKRSGHRPDFVAVRGKGRFAIEVELAVKSRARLEAILNGHLAWVAARKIHAAIYICGDEHAFRRIDRAGDRVGLDRRRNLLRIELLDTIKTEALAAREVKRAERRASASAGWGSMLALDGSGQG